MEDIGTEITTRNDDESESSISISISSSSRGCTSPGGSGSLGSGSSLSFYHFLNRMRNPASLHLVRSIKSFIVSFSFYSPNPESDSQRFQDFILKMEAAIRDHPLWAGASEDEIDSALEGVEKYVMTKLFDRTFALSSEDAKIDDQISDKICLLQNFLKPEHLDIPAVFHNKSSWLLAEEELQKINSFKAPRDKLLCVINCCRVISDMLLNVSMTENLVPGADDFLPVLIYVTIKANAAKIHSNLKYIQLYRRQAKLVSEAAYHLTNLVSAKSFIMYLDAKSLTMDETEFQEQMQATALARERARREPSMPSNDTTTLPAPLTRVSEKVKDTELAPYMDEIIALAWSGPRGGATYPFLEAEADKLSVGDTERLLCVYKDVVNKYTSLCQAIRQFSMSTIDTRSPNLEKVVGPAEPETQTNLGGKKIKELCDRIEQYK